jgi:ABC-type Na+ efflux pump permease subunit
MQIFSALFGIVGMALLLPKDIEDRTLYTILTKPVRRYEYLLGKYLGVLLVLLLSLVIMDILSSAVLHLKYTWAVDIQVGELDSLRESKHWTDAQYAEAKDAAIGQLADQGLRWNLHLAVLAIFLKSSVITAVAMAVSTFAGSTIFTILASLSIYVIGHMQSSARETMLASTPGHISTLANPNQSKIPGQDSGEPPPEPPSLAMRGLAGAVAVVFPDFQVYNVVDAAVSGKTITGGAAAKMMELTAMYLAIYLGVSVLLFSQKEL